MVLARKVENGTVYFDDPAHKTGWQAGGCCIPIGYCNKVKWSNITLVGYFTKSGAGGSNVSITKPASSNLRIVVSSYPNRTLAQGTSYPLSGSITSNCNITSVTGSVVNAAGQTVLNYTESTNTKNYTIRRGKVDMNLKFSALEPGTYTLRIDAVDSSGKKQNWTSAPFTVQGATSSVPTPVPEPTHDTHTKGAFQFAEEVHPHRNYYKCSVCGENFTDGTTSTLDSCQICNPPAKEPTVTPWSDWSTTPAYASATREVETKTEHVAQTETQYRYGRYANVGHDCWCSTYLASLGYGSSWYEATDWSTQRFSTSGRDWTCGSCGGSHTGVDHYGSDGRPWWKEYKSPDGLSYYWEESRTVDNGSDVTYYRYRDKIN